MTTLKRALIPAAFAVALGSSGLANAAATWTLNYADAINALGFGSTVQAASNLTSEYKFTAESLVLFTDVDGSGGISPGDLYEDRILFRIDQLFLDGDTNSDVDTFLKNAQVSGTVIASGIQVTQTSYLVNSASISFYFDSPNDGGTNAAFGGNPNNFVDGVLVQTGTGSGGGSNSELEPDGNININFDLTDLLSTLGEYGVFEQFDPFIPLDQITFLTDSNNNACPPALCASTVAGLESFFGINTGDFDFFFHTRSDGSGIKDVPEPATIALVGLGLMGAGAMRRRARKA